MEVYSDIKTKLFQLPASFSVVKGAEGWYYYTGDHNIEIATGDYPLTMHDLELIAKYQQQISDYYKSLGKAYILMLTPSKVSVYPEPGSNSQNIFSSFLTHSFTYYLFGTCDG